ncbi:hypothetical protein E2C01_053567 [Portunus trituberculatus]|uniref:Uncharacterized protein n=1 Tax=Portunus trituberculatus TaxID=210409 RepID=A0A5B7GSG2_PORTR|nr:hypothetical protein [Portunus trituberculatus]
MGTPKYKPSLGDPFWAGDQKCPQPAGCCVYVRNDLICSMPTPMNLPSFPPSGLDSTRSSSLKISMFTTCFDFPLPSLTILVN